MYRITINGVPLYDPRDEELAIYEAKVKLSILEADSATISLPGDHPALDQIRLMSGEILVYEDDEIIFRGRIISRDDSMDKTVVLDAEGALAYLNDSVIPPFTYPSSDIPSPAANTVENLLRWFVSQHNAQVDAGRQLTVGVVNVSDHNNYISRESNDYSTALEAIRGKLTDPLGGYLRVRYAANQTYLDYLDTLPDTNTQRVEFGENLADLVHQMDASAVYTDILPLGADNLLITSLPDGDIDDDLVKAGEIIYSRSGRQTYGKIRRVVKWDDVTLATNLRTKAAEELRTNGIPMPESISAKAVDLHLLDTGTDALRPGKNTVVISAPHGLTASYPLTEVIIDLLDPRQTGCTLGNEKKSFSGSTVSNQREVQEHFDEQLSVMDRAIANATDWITGANGGTIVTVHDAETRKPTELLILDTDSVATATNVWRFSLGGFGFSSNGYAGPYTTAITQNGQIVADFITTGTMSADRIRAGTLQSLDGHSYWDLATGKFFTESGKVYYAADYSQADIDRAQSIIVGLTEPTEEDFEKYDFFQKGELTSFYLRIMQKMILGLGDLHIRFRVCLDASNPKNSFLLQTKMWYGDQEPEDLVWSDQLSIGSQGITEVTNNKLRPMRKYVVKTGYDFRWKYSLWSDNTLEQWGQITVTFDSWVPWGSLYEANVSTGAVDFLIPFDTPPTIIATVEGPYGGIIETNGAPSATQTPIYCFVRPTNTVTPGSYTVHVYARGTHTI